jgi:hypothetical protein
MTAALVAVASRAIQFSSTQQWLSRRLHCISGASVICAAMLGGGVVQPCQASTVYHYTGNPFDPSISDCFQPLVTCASGNISIDLVVNSDASIIEGGTAPFSSTISGPEKSIMSNGTGNSIGNVNGNLVSFLGGFRIVNGSVVQWAFQASEVIAPYPPGVAGSLTYSLSSEGGGSPLTGGDFYGQILRGPPQGQSNPVLSVSEGSTTKPGTWTSGLTPTFKVQLDWTTPGSGNATMQALATATDATGPITLGQAAKELGVDHFNWIQEVISNPDLTACKGKAGSPECDRLTDITGKVPALPTLDSPLGGWKYEGPKFPTQDFNPFYYDEYFDSVGLPSPSAPEYQEFQVTTNIMQAAPGDFTSTSLESAKGFRFTDAPGGFNNPGITQFVDFLVGVKGGACSSLVPTEECSYIAIPNTDFTWTSIGGVITGMKDTSVDPTAEILPLSPLGCSDPICGETISLDEALSLTGNTLESFDALGKFDVSSVPEPSSLAGILSALGVWILLIRQKRLWPLSA